MATSAVSSVTTGAIVNDRNIAFVTRGFSSTSCHQRSDHWLGIRFGQNHSPANDQSTSVRSGIPMNTARAAANMRSSIRRIRASSIQHESRMAGSAGTCAAISGSPV